VDGALACNAPIRPLQLCTDGGYQPSLGVLRVPLIMVPDKFVVRLRKFYEFFYTAPNIRFLEIKFSNLLEMLVLNRVVKISFSLQLVK
jgi:hypothetical protein